MKWTQVGIAALCGFCGFAQADWSVKNGQLSIVARGTTVETKDFDEVDKVFLPAHSTIDLSFETHDGKKGSRAHQTVAVLSDESTGLQYSFPAGNVKPNGKAKIAIAQKNVPIALQSAKELTLSLLVGSFDDNKPFRTELTKEVIVEQTGSHTKPTRLAAKDEIYHLFREDPSRVPAPIALFFAGGAIALLVIILGFWSATGNFNAFSLAIQGSPSGHVGLLLSLLAYEVTFFRYFRGTSIFDTLSAFAIITPIALFSGSRALSEVKQRRDEGRF